MKKGRYMAGNGDNKQLIEYAEICKNIKHKAREDIRKYSHDTIRETIMASKTQKKVRRFWTKTEWSHTSMVEKSVSKIRS